MLYKVDCKWGCRFLPHNNKSLHKFRTPTKQTESNVQSLIDSCVDIMSHQLKGIENGNMMFDGYNLIRGEAFESEVMK
jgi:hypothetical protein